MEAERFLAVVIVMLVLMAFLWVRPETLAAAWEDQQRLTARWIGTAADSRAIAMIHDWIARLHGWTRDRIEGIADIAVNRWMAERLYVLAAWTSIDLYRAAAFAFMGLYFVPILIAAALDGLYAREIRKTAFVAQSPLMHKLGSYAWKLFAASALVWLLLPYGVPAALVPAASALLAAAVWAWMVNLQKRI